MTSRRQSAGVSIEDNTGQNMEEGYWNTQSIRTWDNYSLEKNLMTEPGIELWTFLILTKEWGVGSIPDAGKFLALYRIDG